MKSKIFSFVVIALLFFTANSFAAKQNEPVARVGDDVILLEEVNENAKKGLLNIEMKVYEVKKDALNKLIEDRLLEREARSLGISADELRKNIKSRAKPVTEEDIKKYYEANKARIKKEFDIVRSNIENFLKKKQGTDAYKGSIKELREKHPVTIYLEPPRFDVKLPKKAIVLGDKNAPVTIVEFTDLECPYCKRGSATIKEIFKKYPGKVRVVHRDFPLAFHKNAKTAAAAVRCADEQNQFWAYKETLFNNQRTLDKENLIRHAAGLGLDTKKLRACIDSGRYDEVIKKDIKEGKSYGVTGTPAFFVNGIFVKGAKPYGYFAEIVEGELARRD